MFTSVKVNCPVCGTPVNGKYKYAGQYYCIDHYVQKSEEINTRKMVTKFEEMKRFFRDRSSSNT